jgi:hypothetical protein
MRMPIYLQRFATQPCRACHTIDPSRHAAVVVAGLCHGFVVSAKKVPVTVALIKFM